jgi:hypothetical protein
MTTWTNRLQPSPGVPAWSAITTRGTALPARVLIALALAALALGVAMFGVVLDHGFGGTSRPAASGVRAHSYSREGLLSLPLAAQGPVSAALGANSRAYLVTPAAGGFRAASPGQHLALGFTRGGVSVASGQGLLGLGLRAVGYGATLQPVEAVTPHLEGDHVVYSHPGVSEWYANGPLGLEQGFTVARAPAGHAVGALTLSIALRGNLRASLTNGGRALTLSRAGHPVLRYTDLLATDARGRTLHSSLILDAHRLLIRVDANGARYPLRIDPFVQQAELTGGGEVVGSGDYYRFGYAVALSSDGDTALVSDPMDNDYAGAVWTFTYSNGAWTQQGSKLTNGSGFAEALALSGDGSTALISGTSGGSPDLDQVFVYSYSNGTWTQQATLRAASDDGNDFGGSVAISDDGDTALISDPNDLGGGGVVPGPGAAWVFQRSGSSWTQQGTTLIGDCASSCTGPNGTGEGDDSGFGVSVALSGDGATALIGAVGGNYYGDATETDAWVFTLSGSTWSQQGPVLVGPPGGNSDGATALSDDGDTALIGSSSDNSYVGAAWVFQRSGSTWTQPGTELTANDTSDFASSVALSDDGDTALIGTFGGDSAGSGEAFVFTDSDGSWTQQGAALTPSDAGSNANYFGYSVALSSCGSALIGAPFDSVGSEGLAGSAWVFTTGAGSCSGAGSGTGSTSGTGTGTAGGAGTSSGTGTSGGIGTGAGGASTGTGSKAPPSLAAQLGLPSTKACLSQRKLTIHVAEHIVQSSGAAKIKSAEVLLDGHVVAKLKGADLIAHVSLAGLAKGSFKITVKATTSAGKTLSASSTFHTCAHAKKGRNK